MVPTIANNKKTIVSTLKVTVQPYLPFTVDSTKSKVFTN